MGPAKLHTVFSLNKNVECNGRTHRPGKYSSHGRPLYSPRWKKSKPINKQRIKNDIQYHRNYLDDQRNNRAPDALHCTLHHNKTEHKGQAGKDNQHIVPGKIEHIFRGLQQLQQGCCKKNSQHSNQNRRCQ